MKSNRLVAFACGFAIWALSSAMTGRAEPWDAKGLYYWASLFAAGFLGAVIKPSEALTAPLWVVAGQTAAILGSVFFGGRSMGLFFPMGLIMLFIFSVLSYAGAFLGMGIRRLIKFSPTTKGG